MHKPTPMIKLPNNWEQELKKIKLGQDIYSPLERIYSDIRLGHSVYPVIDNIFNAFHLCSYHKTNVVIFGQDPYHQKGVANGLAFAVNKGHKIPPSLQNIYKEINDDIGPCFYNSGNLEGWAKQGFFLLNTPLSVIDSLPGSHGNIGWILLVDLLSQP